MTNVTDVYPNAWKEDGLPEEEEAHREAITERFDKAVNQFEEDLKELWAEQARIDKLVREAEQMKSEEYGVPVGTARLGKYVPKSMKNLFGDGEKVDEALIDQITDYYYCYGEALLPVGTWWVTSACY